MPEPSSTHLRFSTGIVAHCLMPPHVEDGYVSESPSFGIGVSFTGHEGAVIRVDGGPAERRSFGPGMVGFNAGAPATWLLVAEPGECVEVEPGPDLLRLVAEETGCDWTAADGFAQEQDDPVIWAACVRLRAAALGGWALEELDGQSLLYEMTLRAALRHFGGRRPEPMRGRLDDRRLDRVNAYLRAHLDRPVELAELSGVAAMSPFHFQRAFRRTTGLSPAAYAAARRAEHARRLLAGGASAAEAARSIGIQDASYFRRFLRRGVSLS
jgi:AraC family transcriptional regulator